MQQTLVKENELDIGQWIIGSGFATGIAAAGFAMNCYTLLGIAAFVTYAVADRIYHDCQTSPR